MHFIICNQNRNISPTLKSKTPSEYPFSPTLTWTDGLYAQARARASHPNNSLRQLSTTIELELYFENMLGKKKEILRGGFLLVIMIFLLNSLNFEVKHIHVV